MSLKHTIRKNIFKGYAHLKYPLPLWKFFNRESVALYSANVPKLNEVQKRILNDMLECGIATATLEELFPGENALEKFQAFKDAREADGSINHKKKFLMDYWDECLTLDAENQILRYSLSPTILDVANTYMGMYSSLLYLTLQKTIPATDGLTNSQNWHRDPQEKKVVKVFTYLNDIDENSGPFTYAKYSAPIQKKYGHLFPQELPAGSYPGNEKVAEAVDAKDITPMTGKAGTIIFCDTNGLHYGGVAKTNPRIMTTFGYSAHTYRENPTYRYDDTFLANMGDMTPQAQHALRKQWKIK